jgi:hypothetical protein
VAGESGVSRSASIFFFAFFFYNVMCTTLYCTCTTLVYNALHVIRYLRRYESTFEGTFVPSYTLLYREYTYCTCTRTRTCRATVQFATTVLSMPYCTRINVYVYNVVQ